MNATQKAWKERNLEKVRKIQRRWYHTHRDEILTRLRTPEARARRREYERAHPEHSKAWKARNRDKVKATQHTYYLKHRKEIIRRQQEYARRPEVRERKRLLAIRYRRKRQDFLFGLKAGKKCRQCGFSDPRALIFHHREGTKKEAHLAEAVSRGWSKQRILDEIKKCVILCANHHLIHHHRDILRRRARLPEVLA